MIKVHFSIQKYKKEFLKNTKMASNMCTLKKLKGNILICKQFIYQLEENEFAVAGRENLYGQFLEGQKNHEV